MSWSSDLVKYASAALEAEDRRLRLLYCTSAEKIRETPTVCLLNEHEITGVIIATVASRLFDYGASLLREKPYPAPSKQRADFAVKEDGPGKNWAYIEVKRYRNNGGKRKVGMDVVKLQNITDQVQRWVLIYRLATPPAPNRKNTKSLDEILSANFPEFKEKHLDSFDTINKDSMATKFELALCKVKNR